jgi:hypothetical protein
MRGFSVPKGLFGRVIVTAGFNSVATGSTSPVIDCWLLATGAWNDSCFWSNEGVWLDG